MQISLHKVICACVLVLYKFILYYTGASGHSLYWIIWEAVRRLEEINLKVSFPTPTHK